MDHPRLSWGNRYAMVAPEHFRIDYVINPYMSLDDQPDRGRAAEQWGVLKSAVEAAGGSVEVIDARQDSPDMVYAMNLGFAMSAPGGKRVLMSHMRFEPRRNERLNAEPWFREHGYQVLSIGEQGRGPCVESGDLFALGDAIYCGFSKRTERSALEAIASAANLRIYGLEIVAADMYHLDLPFCPVRNDTAMVHFDAFSPESQQLLRDTVPNIIELDSDEAGSFMANSIVIGDTIIMPACSQRLSDVLGELGLTVELVDLSEFHKGGGSVRCMTNPLDFDVTAATVPGGEVRLA